MPHEFAPHEDDLKPEAGGSRLGGPPRKYTAAAILDPPVPPPKPFGRTPAIPHPLVKFVAILILIGLAVAAIVYFWR